MPSSKLIVLEGLDGGGKSTVAKALAERLREEGHLVSQYSFPGRDDHALGNWVYSAHHDESSALVPAALQALHIAAHMQSISTLIIPALDQGHWVVLDRFWWSTVAYGRDAGVSQKLLDCLVQAEKLVWGDLQPMLVVFLMRGEARAGSTLNGQYEAVMQSEKDAVNIRRISNNATVFECVSEIFDAVRKGQVH